MNSKTTPKIFVVVLNYNGLATLSGCLSSIFQSDYDNFEVVVVDNNSKDGSLEKARQQFSRAHFIKNSANVGFSQGNNVGIRFALEKFADAVLILNNDALLEKNTLSSLVSCAKNNPRAGIISPIIMNSNNEAIWFAGGIILWDKMKTSHLFQNASDQPYASEYLSGCAMLIKKEVFKKIGLFDQRYFLYYEDTDFSVRASRSGFDLLLTPRARVTHLEQSETTNVSKTYWLVLSGLIFFTTHSSTAQKLWMYPYLWARKIKNSRDVIFSPTPISKDVAKAYRDFKRLSA